MYKIKSKLWILFWIHIYNCLSSGKADDDLSFLGSKDGEFCMTNSTSAMYYTTEDDKIHEETHFLPNSSMRCDFEDRSVHEDCLTHSNTEKVNLVNSRNYENLPIFDKRWEDLPVKDLYYVDKRNLNRLSFTKISTLQGGEHFKVTLSVRTSELHLFLCDKEDIKNANCYWFIIQGWNGNRTVLRKCHQQIPVHVGEYPRFPCSTSVVNIEHPSDYRKFIKFNRWSHLTLEKQGQNLYLRNVENGKTDTVIEYTDKDDDIEVKWLLGRTRHSTAYYKLHETNYLRISENYGNFEMFAHGALVTEKKYCFSFLLTTCRNCWSTFYLFPDSERSKILYEKKVPPSYGRWTEIKLKMENVEYPSVNIRFHGILNSNTSNINSSEIFWALDNYRQCNDNEYRISRKGLKIKECYLLNPAKEIKWTNPKHSYIPDKECESNEQFGDSCIPCNVLRKNEYLNTCEEVRACEFTSNGSKCFCSPGSTGPKCEQVCEPGTYGYGCANQCGNCLSANECRKQDGVCDSCTSQFQGPKCRIPKYDIILKYPPTVVESTSSTCTVQLVNDEYLGDSYFNYYQVQSQKVVSSSRNVESGVNSWQVGGPIRNSEDVDPVVVEGLESNTTYRIRILIASKKNIMDNLHSAEVPFSICNTTCSDEFSEDEGLAQVELKIKSINATLVILSVDNLKCYLNLHRPFNFSYNCECKSIWCESTKVIKGTSLSSEEFTIKNLQPYSYYSCLISVCRKTNCRTVIKREFRTAASIPNGIRELLVTSKGENYTSLRWLAPYPPTGTLKYRISYICKDCVLPFYTSLYYQPEPYSGWKSFHNITLTKNIYDNHTHNIHIEACNEENNEFIKVYKSFDVYVKETASEPPYNLSTRWYENNTLELYWNHPNVTNGNLRGFFIELIVTPETRTFNYSIDERKGGLLYYMQFIKEAIPPSREVYIKVYAENAYKSEPATKRDSSFPVHPRLIDPKIPITNITETTISISLNTSLSNDDENNAKYLFVLINEPASEMKDQNLLKLEKTLNKTIDKDINFRLVAEFNLNDRKSSFLEFVVGQNDGKHTSNFLNEDISNTPLQEAQIYLISILLVNDYKKKYTTSIYSIIISTHANPRMTNGTGVYYLLFLLLLIPTILGFMICYKRRNRVKRVQLSQPVRTGQNMEEKERSQDQPDQHYDVPLLQSITPSPVLESFNILNYIATDIVINSPTYSAEVSVAEFDNYVQKNIETNELERQYQLLAEDESKYSDPISSTKLGTDNVYLDLKTYDKARVKLNKYPGNQCPYINASFIDGYNTSKAYIVTQNPKKDNFQMYWKMIWETNVKDIFMLSNSHGEKQERIEKFWPEIDMELKICNITIKQLYSTVSANLEIINLKLKSDYEEREVEITWFISWPRDDVPLYPQSLVPFIKKMLKICHSSATPIVVQSCEGGGRVGTILLIDMSLRGTSQHGTVDILKNFQKLRKQKSILVGNAEQYKLSYLSVLQLLTGIDTSIPCSEIDEIMIMIKDERRYKEQIDYLRSTEWQNDALEKTKIYTEIYVNHPEKDRFPYIQPGNSGRVCLEMYPENDVSSSYINAVQVDGYRCPERYIVTQHPMPNTLGEFWRLIDEQYIDVIISLNEVDIENNTCCQFLPTVNSVLRPVDYLHVTSIKYEEMPNYSVIYSQLENMNKSNRTNIKTIIFKKWPSSRCLPSSCEEFLSFWEKTDTISRGSKHILITCFDGATASGVFLALSFVIEKIKVEQTCDVCQAVQVVRRHRKQFLTDEKQFVFLLEVAKLFVDEFHIYNNFAV